MVNFRTRRQTDRQTDRQKDDRQTERETEEIANFKAARKVTELI